MIIAAICIVAGIIGIFKGNFIYWLIIIAVNIWTFKTNLVALI